MSTGVGFSGLVSGLDTESLIAQVIQFESKRKSIWTRQKLQLTQRLSGLQMVQTQLLGMQSALSRVTMHNAFRPVTATSSAEGVARVTATDDASPGTYLLEVSQLATNHKIGTSAQTSTDNAIGLNGSFLVNGKQVSVVASDSLRDIAARINNARAGVTASVLSVSSSEHYMVLTAQNSGASNAISLNDLGADNVLQSLGLITSSTSVKHPITNGAQSDRFADTSTSIGNLMALSSAPSGTIHINGVDIAIDLANDSLNAIAARINDAGAGVTASVVAVTENGKTQFRLRISGSSMPTFVDDQRILQTLGILKAGYGNELVQARDAQFKIDSMSLTSGSNVLTNLIHGVTITLTDADAANPKRSIITLTRDVNGIKSAIQDMVRAYNDTVDLIKKHNFFDAETYETGPLFGNATVNLLISSLMSEVSGTVPGLQGDISMLAQVGITLEATGSGKLRLDDAKLQEALNSRLADVERLFRLVGTTSDPRLTYVVATRKTKAEGIPFVVNITQVATQARATASVAQTEISTSPERLTFSGALFNNTEYSITLNSGNTLDDTIAQINADSMLSRYLVASKDTDGKLVLTSKQYGSKAAFTVVSDQDAASHNSGIGTTAMSVQGQDVAGTINGEEATGDGQFLSGKPGNATTDGLQIRVNATTPGVVGTVTVTRGIADRLFQAIQSFTDSISGTLTDETKTIQQQIDDIQKRITVFEEAMRRREKKLRDQFNNLERALSKMRGESQYLVALLNNTTMTNNATNSRRQ